MSTVRKTISMPEKVHEAAKRQMEEYGYAEFSDYIQALIRADTGVQPGSQVVLREQSHEYKSSSAGKQLAEEYVDSLLTKYEKQAKPKKLRKPPVSGAIPPK